MDVYIFINRFRFPVLPDLKRTFEKNEP